MLTASNVSRKLPSRELDAAVDVADDFGRNGLMLLSKSVSLNCNAESTATISKDMMPGPMDCPICACCCFYDTKKNVNGNSRFTKHTRLQTLYRIGTCVPMAWKLTLLVLP